VWLHVVEGHISLGGLTLSQGDGVGITDEPSVSLTADDEAEVLLIDPCPIMPPPLVEGAAPDWSNGA
jgi:redox-sensitive bicupin YhaK (pirin superfamily)